MRTNPLPHGTDPAVEFAGAEKLLLFATTLFLNTVHRSSCVVPNVGVGDVLLPELQPPSCGGGWSSLLSEFGPIPFELFWNVESWTMTWPPELVPEYPSALFSTSAFEIVA